MNWTMVGIGFALAVLMGAAAAALLRQNKPSWSPRRRLLVSASVLPIITLLAMIAGIGFIKSSDHGQGENMEDLAVAAVLALGAGFALMALVGGLLGAALATRPGRS